MPGSEHAADAEPAAGDADSSSTANGLPRPNSSAGRMSAKRAKLTRPTKAMSSRMKLFLFLMRWGIREGVLGG